MCETCVLVDTQTHARRAAALSTSWEQKGEGPGRRHSHSAVPKHVPFRPAHTPAKEHAQGHTQCTAARVLRRNRGECSNKS